MNVHMIEAVGRADTAAVATYLLHSIVDVNHRDALVSGRTAMHEAAYSGDCDMIRFLASKGEIRRPSTID